MTSVRGPGGGALRADSDLRAVRAGGSRACCPGLTALQRARWDLAVLAELAERGTMTLATLRDRQGRIRDFEWLEATPTATMQDALRRIEPLHVIRAPGLVQAVGAGAHENRAV